MDLIAAIVASIRARRTGRDSCTICGRPKLFCVC